MRAQLVMMVGLLLLAVFYLGKGITGYAVSESCCSGPACAAENVCDELRPQLQSPGNPGAIEMAVLLSITVLGIAAAYWLGEHKEKR